MMPDTCTKSPFTSSEQPDDLSMPQPPRPPYFDEALRAWVLSRYADVFAASQDSRLRPTGDKEKDQTSSDQQLQTSIRLETQRALSTSRLSEWQPTIERLASTGIAALKVDRFVDLVSEFAEPLCADVAMIATAAAGKDREMLVELARTVSVATADPDDPAMASAAPTASAELDRCFPSGPIPMTGAAFVALAQTLPSFLARAWLALFRHPHELFRLHASPELMPAAVEELLRYAGLARTITRVAQARITLGGAQIEPGQRVKLDLSSANRDPEQFAEPNRLDLTRSGVRHVALGAGPHSCAGGALIRMTSEAATTAFIQEFHSATICEPVEWRGGAVFRAPAHLLARLRRMSS